MYRHTVYLSSNYIQSPTGEGVTCLRGRFGPYCCHVLGLCPFHTGRKREVTPHNSIAGAVPPGLCAHLRRPEYRTFPAGYSVTNLTIQKKIVNIDGKSNTSINVYTVSFLIFGANVRIFPDRVIHLIWNKFSLVIRPIPEHREINQDG